jgi:hypothetical protein
MVPPLLSLITSTAAGTQVSLQHLPTLGLVVGSVVVRLADDTAADQMMDAEVGAGIALTITTPLPPNPVPSV